MGPPTLRIGWGHPLSGTKEMWMALFVLFADRILLEPLEKN